MPSNQNCPDQPRRTVWLLSAYRADSHAAWADWLQTHLTKIHWRILELPGRHFAWRIRGNPLSWLDRLPADKPDLILATSMVDLATLKGLHKRLANVPCWYYFHENQFAYPRSDRQTCTVEAQMVQLYGALAADRLLFNSEWNRNSFMQGTQDLLDRMPDQVPVGIIERLATKSDVLPVPVEPIPSTEERDLRLILWNHRWEYDKAPELFCRALQQLAARGCEFRLALLGKRGRRIPAPLAEIRQTLADHILIDDWLPAPSYRQWLARSSIAVSTSIHEFQGLGMLEAASAGARPLVPNHLCYPEQFAKQYRYPAGDVEALTQHLVDWLDGRLPEPANVDFWLAARVGDCWRQRLADPELIQSGSSTIS